MSYLIKISCDAHDDGHKAEVAAGDGFAQGIFTQFGSQAIHGNKSQAARQSALGNFKSGKTRVMVATDIASRGIDISELPMVINYDLPDVPETYVHRIGRTGRAGNTGTALTFCSQEERKLVNDIQKLTGKKLNKANFTF